jgi:hypothetical protein
MIIMKFKFIDSSRNKREKDENTIKTTVTEMMIFELKKLLVDTEMFLTLTNEMMMKMKRD